MDYDLPKSAPATYNNFQPGRPGLVEVKKVGLPCSTTYIYTSFVYKPEKDNTTKKNAVPARAAAHFFFQPKAIYPPPPLAQQASAK